MTWVARSTALRQTTMTSAWHAHACREHVDSVKEEHSYASVDHATRRWLLAGVTVCLFNAALAWAQPVGMVFVPAGEFEMGDSFEEGDADELPVHDVYLSPYYIDRYEVTNQQYADRLNWAVSQGGLITVSGGVVYQAGTGADYPYCTTATFSASSRITWDSGTFGVVSGKEDHPMVEVTWYGAAAYCNWRSAMEGRPQCYDFSTWACDFSADGYRLPTEAEWEKAAGWNPVQQRHFRFGEHTDGCGYDCLDGHRANYGNSGDPFETGDYPCTTPVGYYDGTDHSGYQTQAAQSYYGCYDMTGNVYAWCHDWHSDSYYSDSPSSNPTGPGAGAHRVLRGGNWTSNHPSSCRSANRSGGSPGQPYYTWGFRCVVSAWDATVYAVTALQDVGAGGLVHIQYQLVRDGTRGSPLAQSTPQATGEDEMKTNTTGSRGLILPVIALLGLGAATPPTSADLDDGLVGYWSFDEGGGSTAHDSSGHGHHGVIYGNPEFVPGASGTALELDAVDDYVLIPENTPALNPETAITLVAWFRGSAPWGNNSPIFDKGFASHQPPYYQYHLGIAIYRFSFDLALEGQWRHLVNGAWRVGVWHHVAGTYDGSTQILYVDGQEVARQITSGDMTNYGKLLHFGKFGNLDYYLKGAIDELRIYNRALSQDEIRQLYETDALMYGVVAAQESDAGRLVHVDYQLGQGGTRDGRVACATPQGAGENQMKRNRGYTCGLTMPVLATLGLAMVTSVNVNAYFDDDLVGYWSFDEGEGTVAHDSSGHGNHGTIHGTTWVAGVSGAALSFDGTTDYVNCGTGITSLGGYAPFSLSVWIQRSDNPNWQLIISRYDWHVDGEFYVGLYEGRVTFLREVGPHVLIGDQYLTPSIWHHIVASYDGATKRIYVDGELDAWQSSSGSGIAPSTPVLIGALLEYTSAVRFFDGAIDDVRIYSRALSEEEIEVLYENPGGLVSVVTASQRQGADKNVDADYTLGGRDDTYTITLQISDDGGQTWEIVPTALWGDIGEGIVPGEDKHIVWNPAVDIPGISGDNFMVRVIADEVYYADSNVFSIVAAGPGDVQGTVRDQSTGDAVVGAEVSLNGGEPVVSDDFGFFAFTEVPAGEATLDVSADGYYPLSEIKDVREDSYTDASVLLTSDQGFGVVDVRGQYCGPAQHVYYLDWVWLDETFTATIDWDIHGPGELHWITPYETYVDDCSWGATTVTRGFNMGLEFGVGGTLQVQAVGEDATQSVPYRVNFEVIPTPQGILPFLLEHEPAGGTLKYVTEKITREVGPDEEEEMSIEEGVEAVDDDEVPLFKDEKFKFGGTFEASAEVTGDGRARGPFFEVTADREGDIALGKKKTRVAGLAVNLSANGQVDWDWNDSLGRWQPGGWIELGANVSANVPPNPHYIIFFVGPIPVPVYFRGRVELAAVTHLEMVDWLAPGQPDWHGRITLDPFPYAEANMGVGVADLLAAEGYLGGGARIIIVFPRPDPLDTLQIFLAGGVRLVVFGWQEEWPLLEYTWDFLENRWVVKPATSTFRPIPRDYLRRDGGYAVWVANDAWRSKARDAVTVEGPLQLNVFGQSTPHLAAIGNDLLLTWVYDDPIRTPTNRTQIVFSQGIHDGGEPLPWTWDEPAAVADDGTADFHPHVSAWSTGDALLAWENVSEVLIEPGEPEDPCLVDCEAECADPGSPECLQCLHTCKLEELKNKLEIAVARYDDISETWDTQSIVTDNTWLDRSPRVATAADGTALLTWVSNTANDELGSVDYPNDIHYALYDGVAWSVPADVALGVPSVIKSTVAYRGDQAIFLFTGDTDGSDETPEDRELFAIEFDGVTWGPVLQLTDDPPGDPDNPPLEDANPRVAYDATGEPVIVWYRGGDVYFAADLALIDPQLAIDLEGNSSGMADFRLATGPDGQIALVWQEASDDVVDMWYALYMTTVDDWTQPRRLTADRPMEHAFAPVICADGSLVSAHNKVAIEYETREVEVSGEIITVDNVPAFDQSDLYLLWHTVSGELGILDGDIIIEPANPVPGSEATITATVHNLGDTPAENIDVAFYDGDPDAGGVLIEMPVIVGPVGGGESAEVSVLWLIPPSIEPRTVYVVVDPLGIQEDGDPDNNEASLTILAPDVTITGISVQAAGNDRIITMRVENAGALTVVDAYVDLRRDTVAGELLAALAVTEPLVPGAFRDVVWVWEDIAPIVGGEIEIFTIADPADVIVEFDEENNTRSALVTNMLAAHPGDWNQDGSVDLDDFGQFPGCMSGPWGVEDWIMPSVDCRGVFDFDADADVDLADFVEFQQEFDGGTR